MIGKRLFIFCLSMLLMSVPVLAQDEAPESAAQGEAETPIDPIKLSYAVGYLYGSQLKAMGMDFNLERLTTGLKDAVNEVGPAVPEEEMRVALQKMEEQLRRQQMQQFQELAAKNLREGQEFLNQNAEEKGVEVLPSGLQYRVIEEGSGDTPSLEDTVVVHYRSSLPTGFEFDSSYARGRPVTFQVKSVIKGWQEALTMMREGAKWQVFVPADLAYGETGKRPIGPNQTLVFDLELVEIKEDGGE